MLRSGLRLSFMVVTDDADRFVRFAASCGHLADHFLMATPSNPRVAIATGILPIPPG